MSEEILKKVDNVFELFQQSQMTYEEAEEKAKKEVGAPQVERFRTGEDGEYSIRILPLAPSIDENGNVLPMERKGYEYAVHQLFITLVTPNSKGKDKGRDKKMSIPVIRTTDKEVGYSVDLIDTYVKIANEMYGDDKELMGLIANSAYYGGLRWNYQHAIMVLDVSTEKTRAKGPQIWQCSHSQYKDIDAAKMRLWKELRGEHQNTCPISGFKDAYPVKIIRETEKNNTSYTIEIGRKTLDITQEEAMKLLDLPRIPEQIYRYTRYQFEATIEFLKQYDEKHGMEVCKESDFIEAIEKLKGELPADDSSHFTFKEKDVKEGEEEVTIDSLWREYDVIVDQDLNEKSDEYQELREKIRQYIESHDLDVRISRSKGNQQLLEEIDEAEEEAAKSAKKDDKPEKEQREEAPARRAPRPKAVPAKDEPDDEPEEQPEKAPEEETADDAEQEASIRRRRRPTVEDNGDGDNSATAEGDDANNEPEEQPSRRARARRTR